MVWYIDKGISSIQKNETRQFKSNTFEKVECGTARHRSFISSYRTASHQEHSHMENRWHDVDGACIPKFSAEHQTWRCCLFFLIVSIGSQKMFGSRTNRVLFRTLSGRRDNSERLSLPLIHPCNDVLLAMLIHVRKVLLIECLLSISHNACCGDLVGSSRLFDLSSVFGSRHGFV